MKKEFAIAWMIVMAIAVLFSILMLPPVMAADENATGMAESPSPLIGMATTRYIL
jgi:hypothetical protein